MATDFPEPRWAVPQVIPEGVTLLAGAPKVGKSWLMLGLSLSVASGGMALGKIQVAAGPVLYLALEDRPRRLKARLGRMLGPDTGRAPAALTLETICPPLPEGGEAYIARWLEDHPDARLVIVDVFTRMRGPVPPGSSAYTADYNAVARFKALADAHGIAIILVHHVRKPIGGDFVDDVSGTNGLAGAADAIAVLKRSRGEADAVLYVTGRDVDEGEHAMKFHPALGAWELLDGPAIEHILEPTRAAIYKYLEAHGDAAPKQISDGTGLDYENVKKTCRRMVEGGQLETDGAGRYRPLSLLSLDPNAAGQSPNSQGHPLSLSVPREAQ
jgi:hypothetical protein